jgi:glycosyltransferase involved in cell wall biosynthesis
MRLLLFIDWFLPGYKAGGQISSCANIIYALKDEPWQIYVVTRDRDLDDSAAYPGIKVNEWNTLQDNTKVMYLSPGNVKYKVIRDLLKEVQPNTIYFNSMFSWSFTLLPLWVIKRMQMANKIVLAPRGMLQKGALQFKSSKKKLVLAILHYSGVLNGVLFHATDEVELADIKENIQGMPQVKLVYDFPGMQQPAYEHIEKKVGSLRCLFVSRVVGKKNLLYLLQRLGETSKEISLTIVGPVEDREYWKQCLQQIDILPLNCNINYKGAVPNTELSAIYREHHVFVLPTLGENFGHVIFDSFLNGRPVIISDQTPWRELAGKKAGFDINLADREVFVKEIEYMADMDTVEFNSWGMHAWQFGQKRIEQLKELTDEYKSLFN